MTVSMLLGDFGGQITGYQIDSRLIKPGNLFFAGKGEKVDGHAFLQDAAALGAIGAVVDAGYQGESYGLRLIRSPNVLETLHAFAKESLRQNRPRIVGVTGSVGKTTTKEFLAALLAKRFRVGKTEKSYNTKWTLPLCLLNRRKDEEILVLEMGMSEPHDLLRLVETAPPEIGVLTKVALAHAAYFPGGLAEIAKGKGEIFSHPDTKVAVYHQSVMQFPEAFAKVHQPRLSYSLEDATADFFLSPEGDVDERGVRAFHLEIPFSETHFRENLLGAICVARLLGVSFQEIQEAMKELPFPKMRFEKVEQDGIVFINDAYNANPASMRAALCNLPKPSMAEGRRIAVLGSMQELGIFSQAAHQEIGELAAQALDHVFLFGEETSEIVKVWENRGKRAEKFEDKEVLLERLKAFVRKGDVVLCKGSRSLQLETILQRLLEHASSSH